MSLVPPSRRLLPLGLRVFGLQFGLVLAVTAIVLATFGNLHQQVLIETMTPAWAPAIRQALTQEPVVGAMLVHQASRDIQVRQGPLPQRTRSIRYEARYGYFMTALRAEGLDVVDVRVQDDIAEPLTWVGLRQATGEVRWIGMVDGIQVPRFLQRWYLMLGTSLGLLTLLAWWQSARVVRPIKRLMSSLDAIGQGAAPRIETGGLPELRRLGHALSRLASDYADRDEQRRLMLAGISHDLRSPLARIRLAADLMAPDTPERLRIMGDVDLADGILDMFLLYVRTEAEFPTERIDLALVARQAASAQGVPAHLSEGADYSVDGNALLLRRAIDNLLDNARVHGAAPVLLTLDSDAQSVWCRVSDAGSGLPLAELPRLLRPFERGAAHRGLPGSGLGLTIAQRIALKHGGRLEFESGARGACVGLRLPKPA